MIKPAKINASKASMFVLFVSAIIVFFVGIALDMVGAFTHYSSHVNLYVLIIEIVLMSFYIFASFTIMIWNPENKGRTILISMGTYVALSGLVSAISSVIYLVGRGANVTQIISVSCSVIQLGVGVMSLVLLDHKPMASIVCSFISFIIFAINNCARSSSYFESSDIALCVYCLLATIFDVIVLFILLKLMKKYDSQRKRDALINVEEQK